MTPISHTPVVGEVLAYRPGGIYSEGTIEVRVTKVWPSVCEVVSTSGNKLKNQRDGMGLRVHVALLYK